MTTHQTLNENGKLIAEGLIKTLKAEGVEAKIEKTYRDFGADMTWDTIIVNSKTGSYQALSPRQYDDMNNGALAQEDIVEILSFAKRMR